MGIVSHFFKLSHYLKEINNVMLIDYGLPPWVTYVLFAIATILLGALLGLVLVSIIDLFFPPVPHNTRTSYKQNANIGSTDEDARDVLEDDADTAAADEDPQSTSDGEKFSGSDSDESNNDEKEQVKQSNTKERKGTRNCDFIFYCKCVQIQSVSIGLIFFVFRFKVMPKSN